MDREAEAPGAVGGRVGDADQAPAEGAPAGLDAATEDILAEQDAEERRGRSQPLAPAEAEDVPEDVLAERDADRRAADEAVVRREAGE